MRLVEGLAAEEAPVGCANGNEPLFPSGVDDELLTISGVVLLEGGLPVSVEGAGGAEEKGRPPFIKDDKEPEG